MKEAREKWVPCTATFPDYEICLGPVIAIRRVKTAQGSYKGKTIAIQHYRGQFWVTMRNRFGETKRVNVLDMANWSAAANWKRQNGASQKADQPEESRPARQWVTASEPVAVSPPQPLTRDRLLRMRTEVERANYADFVKRNELRRIDEQLAALAPTGE